jgi:hypothetical protein
VVLALLRWHWSLSGRDGLGHSLPPAELARRDSGVSRSWNDYFPLRRKSEKKQRRTEVTLLDIWHTCEHFELSNTPPTHLSCFFTYSKWDWVIQVHLHYEIASSWHLVVDSLRDSCFSWLLPPPRRLGAAWRHWQELVIILGHLQWLWGVCAYLGEAPTATLVNCSCHCNLFPFGRFLWRLLRGSVWDRLATKPRGEEGHNGD